MERDNDWCERCFKYVFHFLCGVATVGFTIYCVHQYIKDEDVARIEFAEFNAEEDNIYPTITLCFPSPLIEEKLAEYGEGITVETYSNFLTGQNNSWDDRMAKIDYDDVSINIEDFFLGKFTLSCHKTSEEILKVLDIGKCIPVLLFLKQ